MHTYIIITQDSHAARALMYGQQMGKVTRLKGSDNHYLLWLWEYVTPEIAMAVQNNTLTLSTAIMYL